MVDVPSHDVTRLLAKWQDGDEAALQQLLPIVHEELSRLAPRQTAAPNYEGPAAVAGPSRSIAVPVTE